MHTCHAHGCGRRVPPKMFACRQHWFALRKPLRDAIWCEYREGQEDDKNPSPRYMAVQRLAVSELAFKPNDEEAARTAGGFMVQSEVWRTRAIKAGLGDPLEALITQAPTMVTEEIAVKFLRGES